MQRPLPPYRVKPLRTLVVRRTFDTAIIHDLATDEPISIRPARNTLKIAKPGTAGRLKVLGRTANDTH